jgi:hypothetical protein
MSQALVARRVYTRAKNPPKKPRPRESHQRSTGLYDDHRRLEIASPFCFSFSFRILFKGHMKPGTCLFPRLAGYAAAKARHPYKATSDGHQIGCRREAVGAVMVFFLVL